MGEGSGRSKWGRAKGARPGGFGGKWEPEKDPGNLDIGANWLGNGVHW